MDYNKKVEKTCSKIAKTPFSDGGWSAWETWGSCSVTCGSGIKSRFRACTNPKQSPYGQYCEGHNSEIDICSHITCGKSINCFNDKTATTTKSKKKIFIVKYTI
jgi:phage-related protein